MRSVWAI